MKNRPMMHVLFYTRLLLYLAVVIVPFVHPAILVPYDATSIGLWFVIVPGMMFLAFYFSPPLLRIRFWLLISTGCLLLAAVIFAGFTAELLTLIIIGLLSFALTALVFKTEGKGRVAAALELFFIGALYYAFLNFSRSSEEIAEASTVAMKVLFILSILTFIIHAVVLFAASFPRTLTGRGKRNIFILVGILAPAALLASLFLPVDFIRHEVRLNPLEEELERQLEPLEGFPNSPFNGNTQDRENRLQGLSEEQWESLDLRRRRSRGGRQRQFSVMVVATGVEELYLGEKYYGHLDPVHGLLLSDKEYLNELSTLRLIETWQNPILTNDQKRIKVRAIIYSTLKERFLAYRPFSFTPMVKDEEMRPFQYDYEGMFEVSSATEDELFLLGRPLNTAEKEELAEERAVNLDEQSIKGFRIHLDKLIMPGMTDFEKILAILNGFKDFQYELGYDELVHTAKILNFVLDSKTGDCTEFANATAILARLAGVPSRVVTGFLASHQLQLPMHQQGLLYLQEQYETLKGYKLSELILVTTAHRHAWAQVYIAPFGWLDVEATIYAIPPPPGGDANESPLVLPKRGRISGKAEEAVPFPWLTLLAIIGIGAAAGCVILYLVKYMRLLILILVSKRNTLRGLRAMQKLLLMKLIVRGFPYKPGSLTILEYAETNRTLVAFAQSYTELRYHSGIAGNEATLIWQTLRKEFAALDSSTRKKSNFWRELFSLEGFRY